MENRIQGNVLAGQLAGQYIHAIVISLSKLKSQWARLVLGWGTTLETAKKGLIWPTVLLGSHMETRPSDSCALRISLSELHSKTLTSGIPCEQQV